MTTKVAEGAMVSWVGPGVDGYEEGDTGRLLAFASHTHAHVMWSTGAREGQADLVAIEDLTTKRMAQRDLLADSLEVGGLEAFAVRQVMDAEGEAGVLNTMSALGHLTAFSSIAADIMTSVSARIRQDPSFRAVTAHLDDDEAEALIRLATTCLVRDAFTDDIGEG